jgi:hypothetical protein
MVVVGCGPTAPVDTATTTSSSTTTSVADGWVTVFTETFDTPAASFPGPYSNRFGVYPDGARDTAALTEGAPSRYYPSDVLSVAEGMLTKRLRVDQGTPKAAGVVPLLPGTPPYTSGWPNINGTTSALLEARYTIRWRTSSAPGWKLAWLLWPETEQWPRDGEIDFPEGNLDATICGFVHRQNATVGSDQHAACSWAPLAGQWHTTVIERVSGRVTFLLDGAQFGTWTDRLPDKPMTWRIQTETCFPACQPTGPAVIDIDSVQIDVPA